MENSLHNDRIANTWIFSGPIGSGRETLAYEFVYNLLGRSQDSINLEDNVDVLVIKTAKSSINVETMREAVRFAELYPQNLPYRVIIVHDADRMNVEAQNTILKALEEPAETSIWVLLTPSSTDLLTTIRSRARIIHLKSPKTQSIIAQLVSEGIAENQAKTATKLAGGHIGMARILATKPELLNARLQLADNVLSLRSVTDSLFFSEKLIKDAETSFKNDLDNKYDQMENDLLANNGIEKGQIAPKYIKAQLKVFEDDKKQESRRGFRDYLDLQLSQIELLYRDLALTKLQSDLDLIAHEALLPKIQTVAAALPLTEIIKRSAAIRQAKVDILHTNVKPQMLIEELFTTCIIL